MIDNFNLIKNFLSFTEDSNSFMHCQIVKRAKDFKDNKIKEGSIKTYFIRSKNHLEQLKPEIIAIAEALRARVYINISEKNFDKLQKLVLSKISADLLNNSLRDTQKLVLQAAGELKSNSPKWIVDVDNITQHGRILNWLIKYYNSPIEEWYYGIIPTVQGEHIITKPFNVAAFQTKFPEIDVHKNSMGTLLYYPKSCDRLKED